MSPKWTVSVLWRDSTQLLSWFVLLRMWLEMGFFNKLLKYLCILEMRKVLKVPISIDSISVGFNALNYLEIRLQDIRVKPPPISLDDRWELEDIVRIDVVKVSIPFVAGLYLYLCSWGTLMHADVISVHGLRFYIEGYREIDEKMTFNISLLGKKMEELLPRGVDQLVLKNEMDKVEIVENYFSASSSKLGQSYMNFSNMKQCANNENSESPLLSSKKFVQKYAGIAEETIQHLPISPNHHLRERGISRDGLIKSAKEKIHSIYENAKHNIEERIYEKLNALHVYVQGQEPVSTGPNIVRTICRHVIFDYIEINLVRALPYRLRHIERRPSSVDFLQFNFLGYENLDVLSATQNFSQLRCVDCHDSVQYPLKLGHKIICKRCNDNCGLSTPRARYNYVSPIEGEVQHNESNNSFFHRYNTNDDNFHHENSGVESTSMFVDLFSISIPRSGLDIVIFKYWFERKLLFGIYKQNMKKLAQDILNFNPFQGSSEEEKELEEIVVDHSDSRINENKSAPNHHWATKRQSFHNSTSRGIVQSHPIFF